MWFIEEWNKGRSMYDIVYTFNHEPTEFNGMKVLKGLGLTDSKKRSLNDSITTRQQDSPDLMTWFENLDWSNQKLKRF
jgi:hypothetical protein